MVYLWSEYICTHIISATQKLPIVKSFWFVKHFSIHVVLKQHYRKPCLKVLKSKKKKNSYKGFIFTQTCVDLFVTFQWKKILSQTLSNLMDYTKQQMKKGNNFMAKIDICGFPWWLELRGQLNRERETERMTQEQMRQTKFSPCSVTLCHRSEATGNNILPSVWQQ